jgi:hypothetical protein
MAETIRNFTTKRECSDGDWKTQLARGYANIPAGRPVHFDKLWMNMEGVWARVQWQGRTYDVRPDALRIVTQEVVKAAAPRPGIMAQRKKEDIQLVGQIPLWDENLQPVASHCWLAINSVNDIIQIQESECEYFYELSNEFEERIRWNVLDPSNYYFEKIER